MNLPKYVPGLVVVYRLDKQLKMGEIQLARSTVAGEWVYIIKHEWVGPHESQITHILDMGRWIPVSRYTYVKENVA